MKNLNNFKVSIIGWLLVICFLFLWHISGQIYNYDELIKDKLEWIIINPELDSLYNSLLNEKDSIYNTFMDEKYLKVYNCVDTNIGLILYDIKEIKSFNNSEPYYTISIRLYCDKGEKFNDYYREYIEDYFWKDREVYYTKTIYKKQIDLSFKEFLFLHNDLTKSLVLK